MKTLVRFLLLCFFLLFGSGYVHAFVCTVSSSCQNKSEVHITNGERYKYGLLNDISTGETDVTLNTEDEDEENEEHDFTQDVLLSVGFSFLPDSINPGTGNFYPIHPAFYHNSPIYITQRTLRI